MLPPKDSCREILFPGVEASSLIGSRTSRQLRAPMPTSRTDPLAVWQSGASL